MKVESVEAIARALNERGVDSGEMIDGFDWSVTTFDGDRRLQDREFLALPFREKLQVLENMAAVAKRFGDAGSGEGRARRARPAAQDRADD